MVRTNPEADDETPAENPPAFADLVDTVDDLEEGDRIRVVYAHKTRHTLSEPDTTTTIEGDVDVADATFDDDRTRFRLEFRGGRYRIKAGGVNKTESNPCFVSKSTGPSVRHFNQLGRVDSIEVVDDDPDVVTDGGVAVTRRTRRDLRAFADAVTHTSVDRDAVDVDRLRRFEAHGWATNDATSTTGDGYHLAGVVDTLRNADAEVDDLDYVVDIMGMDNFVSSATGAESPHDAVAYMRGLLVVANTIDEARHEAGTQDVEYDHDGLFAPHFADFNSRGGRVEVRFKDKSTASVYRRKWCPDRYDVERKHDERFKSNRNPRRLVVDVTA